MAERDRLDWILNTGVAAQDASTDDESLEARYDQWAGEYDDDHEEWGWRGPELVAEAVLRLRAIAADESIHDAGCGTGKAGLALRRGGWQGEIVGLDFSQGMLDVAETTEAYGQLIKCSLDEIPLPDDASGAVVSSGVFTHGHVGGEALGELARITRPGGVVAITQRLDIEDQLQPHIDRLIERGIWRLLERSSPASLHPQRNGALQTITTWQVL